MLFCFVLFVLHVVYLLYFTYMFRRIKLFKFNLLLLFSSTSIYTSRILLVMFTYLFYVFSLVFFLQVWYCSSIFVCFVCFLFYFQLFLRFLLFFTVFPVWSSFPIRSGCFTTEIDVRNKNRFWGQTNTLEKIFIIKHAISP